MPDDDREQKPEAGRGLRRSRLKPARAVRVRHIQDPDTERVTSSLPDQDGSARGEIRAGSAAVARTGLSARIADLSVAIEKMNLAEYTALLQQPWRLVWVNFVAGLARGLGMAVGFSVLGALLLYFLRNVIVARLPDLADLMATIVQMVELNLRH